MKRKKTSLALVFFLLISLLSLSPVLAASPEPEWRSAAPDRPALDVPYVPTPEEVVNEMLNLAGVNSRDVLYDLGCGDGRIVVTAAKERNVRKAVGVDLDPQRIREGRENARAAGVSERTTFYQKDLFDIDLRDATVVSLYLLPSVNLRLRPKLLAELKPGTRIVSHDFDMGDWQPDREVQLNQHAVYYWIVPARVSGVWQWSLTDGTRTHRYRLQLRQHFQNLYRAELKVDGTETPIGTIKLTGNQLEFTITGVNGEKEPVRFTGFVKGDTITGAVTDKGNPAPVKKKWTAQRNPGKQIPVDASSADKI